MGIKKVIFTITSLAIVFTAFLVQYSLGMAVLVTFLTALFFLSFFVLNNILIKDTKPPNIFTDTHRNFRFLLLGSTKIWKNTDVEKVNRKTNYKIISFAFYKRNLYTDFFVLQRMFSYLEKNGTVIITIDLDDRAQFSSEKLTYADYRILHPLTLHINNFKVGALRKKYPLFFYPGFSIGYIVNKAGKKLFRKGEWGNKSTKVLNDNVIPLAHEKLITRIGEMVQFCYERELDVKVACLAHSKNAVHTFREVDDRIKIIYPGLEVFRLNRLKDFEALIDRKQENRKKVRISKYISSLFNFYLFLGIEYFPYALVA